MLVHTAGSPKRVDRIIGCPVWFYRMSRERRLPRQRMQLPYHEIRQAGIQCISGEAGRRLSPAVGQGKELRHLSMPERIW
jgi:hypothetical protein